MSHKQCLSLGDGSMLHTKACLRASQSPAGLRSVPRRILKILRR